MSESKNMKEIERKNIRINIIGKSFTGKPHLAFYLARELIKNVE